MQTFVTNPQIRKAALEITLVVNLFVKFLVQISAVYIK